MGLFRLSLRVGNEGERQQAHLEKWAFQQFSTFGGTMTEFVHVASNMKKQFYLIANAIKIF
jgi:hypothetical protein